MSDQDQEPVGKPSGYNRSFRGLVAAMIVTVIAVTGFWWLSTSWSQTQREERTGDRLRHAEWRPAVKSMQDAASDAGVLEVVYPSTLPEGWYANYEPRYDRGETPVWRLGFVRGEEHYVGVLQTDASAWSLVNEYVDENAEKGERVTVGAQPGADLGRRWQSWSDEGGDYALTARHRGTTILVWGPGRSDVEEFTTRLTTEPIEDANESEPDGSGAAESSAAESN